MSWVYSYFFVYFSGQFNITAVVYYFGMSSANCAGLAGRINYIYLDEL